MVSKMKLNCASNEQTEEEHHDDIYLNDVPVEIKQEEELIIEDDGGQVRWCFIGLDDNEDEEQEFCADVNPSGDERQIASLNMSCEEVIEITDDDDMYHTLHSFVNGNDSGEIGVSNEPIHETSFTIESGDACNALQQVSLINDSDDDHHGDQEGNSHNLDLNNDCHTEEEPDNDTKEFIDENTSPTTRSHRRSKENVNDSAVNEEYLSVATLKEMVSRKYMKIKCHLCNEVFSFGPYSWTRHMREKHQDFYTKMLSIYKFQTENLAFCKLCKSKINFKLNHMCHYILQHMEITPKIFLCFCDYADSSVCAVQQHQKEKHPLDEEENCEKCPKCLEGFKNTASVEFHFFASHSREFWGKFRYNCHLCDNHHKFDSNKKNYYSHLINEHKLNNWKTLRFKKFDNGRYLQCTECLKIFTNVEDFNKLLGHFLTHQVQCFWTCKYCESKNRFHDWPALHLCTAMKNVYLDRIKNKDDEDNKASIQKLISWNEFEVYVKHICPFCMDEFDKFEDWRLHIREIHFIHTLEGLNMTIIPDDPEKLQCLQCFAPITKSAVELHKHRFQHLPYQPYKCRHCMKSLAAYNLALKHVLSRCENDVDVKPSTSKVVQIYKLKTETICSPPDTLISIYCPLCNNKRFSEFDELSTHFRSVHNNFQQYYTNAPKGRKCKICHADIYRSSNSVIVYHYLQHLDEKPFKCRKCQRSYAALKHARKHVNNYHFSSLAITDNPQKVVKREKEVEPEKPRRSIKREKDVDPEKAEKSIKKEVETAKSQKSVKREKDVEATKAQKSVKRETEVKKSGKIDNDVEHALFLDEGAKLFKQFAKFITYACPECNESLSSLQLWEHHIQTQHTFFHAANLCVFDRKARKPKCIDCNSILSDFASKQRKHKLTHLSHTAFLCTLCQARFTQIGALYIHLRKTHFAECSLKCPLCPKILRTAYAKSEHMKQSHSRKEWPSDMCVMCFQQADDMDSHIRINHNRSENMCGICGISCKHTKALAEHMATKHNQRNGKDRKDDFKAITLDTGKGTGFATSGKRKLNRSTTPSEDNNNAKKLCVRIRSNGRKLK